MPVIRQFLPHRTSPVFPFRAFLPLRVRLLALVLLSTCFLLPAAYGQEPGPLPEAAEPALQQAPAAQPAPITRQTPTPNAMPSPAAAPFDKTIFLKPFAPAQLTFLTHFEGAPARDLYNDRQFRKLMKGFVPDCLFHYGRDMPLDQALDAVLSSSRDQVIFRENRYLLLSGERGPYLGGRGFLWIDLVDGLGLGGFYFQPTNGEPSPTLAVFSRQVKETTLALSELPPAFIQDMNRWMSEVSVAPVTTRYFLNGANKRILLEHDEDFCSLGDGTVAPPGSGCEQMNADAADTDETAAYYLEQIHYATNGTAWSIGPDQVAWIGVRDRTCGGVADPLGCRIRVTREHTGVILHRGPIGRPMPGPRH